MTKHISLVQPTVLTARRRRHVDRPDKTDNHACSSVCCCMQSADSFDTFDISDTPSMA